MRWTITDRKEIIEALKAVLLGFEQGAEGTLFLSRDCRLAPDYPGEPADKSYVYGPLELELTME